MNEIFLGYDFRACKKTYVSDRWDSSNRKQYLLREDIDWPISVDEMVWPSLFCYEESTCFSQLKKIFCTPVNSIHGATRFWPSLDVMNNFVTSKYEIFLNEWISIGVGLLKDRTVDESDYWNSLIDESVSRTKLSSSDFFGYDIADQYCVSGLFNCGYTYEEKVFFQKKWLSKLNKYGLLTSQDDAVEFQNMANKRVPEHSPFFIYAIYDQSESKIKKSKGSD